ncbi:MAG: ubiquitin-like domain-containing protein [Bifidobacteriaceae bacterium]|jgi:uncharacterized protein YabE (DUF348 family)|nr:ubiquitin-like domain-containing protein [Bifidobacteriaceae bacterium]
MSRPRGHAAPAPRREQRRRAKRSRQIKLTARLTVLAFAAAGIAGFAASYKTVTVTVDGVSNRVSTFASTVDAVLAAEGVSYTERDLVAPGPDAGVPRSGEIVVRTAHALSLQIDGDSQIVWTTAPTVDEALADLGVRAEEAALSVARSTSVSEISQVVNVSTAKPLMVIVDGAQLETYSNAATVGELLGELGVVLGPLDQVEPALAEAPEIGLDVTVHRAVMSAGSETIVVPFEIITKEDPNLAKGTKVIKTAGVAGQKVVTFTATVVNGVEVDREVLLEATTVAPIDQVVVIGTKKVIVPPSVDVNVDPGSAQGIARQMMLDSYGWGDDQFACLLPLWQRESGWRVNAQNRSSGAYGIPQALPGSKMASAGADWRTNPATQIKWGLGYISGRYKTPCGAWSAFLQKGWY